MSNANVVVFSADSINKLKKIFMTNQSIKIMPGEKILRSVSECKTIAVETTFDIELPRMLCIYDIREFLNMLNIIKDPVVDLTDSRFALIKSKDGKQVIRYLDSGENIVNSSYMKKLPTIPSEDLKLAVSEENLRAAISAANNLSLDYVGFTSDGVDIFLKAFNTNNGDNGETNAFSINLGPNPEAVEFKLFYKTKSWASLEGDCEFVISKKRLSKVVSKDTTYFLVLDVASSYDGE
jgi:hypothetical protein